MHEAGLAAAILDQTLAAAGTRLAPGAHPTRLEVQVTDATQVAADALELHLRIALHERGLSGVPVDVTVLPITCPACGEVGRPAPAWPFCAGCGQALPERPGSGVRVSLSW
jgi:Zn finger protein HypA/HybF involved in hydrogenase expression